MPYPRSKYYRISTWNTGQYEEHIRLSLNSRLWRSIILSSAPDPKLILVTHIGSTDLSKV